MMTKSDSTRNSILSRLWRDRAGNFGIATAVILPVAAATAGVALDYNNMVQVRAALQDSADAAVLSAANALTKNNTMSDAAALEMARRFLKAQFLNVVPEAAGDSANLPPAEDPLAGAVGNVVRTTQTSGKAFEVTLSPSFTVPTNGLTALLGWKQVTISVTATAVATTESKNALSMYLVLDRSGSMAEDTTTINEAVPRETVYYNCGTRRNPITCSYDRDNYYTKIEALKVAVASLTTQLNGADPESKYVRTAAVSYNASMQSPVSFDWGTTKSMAYVQALTATGGTDSSDAMARAFSDISDSSEDTAHKNRNGQEPSKFIIFMTDGDNNYSSADVKTRATCESAKTAGVEIFTVAFMAPSKGRALLENCASSTSHYYDAQNAAELVAAFKEIGDKAVEAATRLTN